MRALYMKGRLGHTTMVRWLPVSYSRPEAAAQHVDGFSPLQELCSDEGPPFMDAPLDEPNTVAPATARAAVDAAVVRFGRVDGRQGLHQGKHLCGAGVQTWPRRG